MTPGFFPESFRKCLTFNGAFRCQGITYYFFAQVLARMTTMTIMMQIMGRKLRKTGNILKFVLQSCNEWPK